MLTARHSLVLGLLGTGKTRLLTSELLQAAQHADKVESNEQVDGSGGILALVQGQEAQSALRTAVDLERPIGCTRCSVLTFSSFLRSIVHEFGPAVGIYDSADHKICDSNRMAVFLHRHLDKLPLGRYKPRHAPEGAVRPLLNLFRGLAQCGVGPEEYIEYARSLEAPQKMGLGVGASGAEDAAVWREHVAGEMSKAKSYETFVALKREAGIVDMNDQLLLAKRIFVESASARAVLAARYSHVFVDDLHAYAPAMVDVLGLMISQHCKVTASADPYLQTNLGTNRQLTLGADRYPIALFRQAFPEAIVRNLEVNYRSTPAVQQAMLRLYPREGAVDRRCRVAAKGESAPIALEVGAGFGNDAHWSYCTLQVKDGGNTREHGSVTCLPFYDERQELRAIGNQIQQLIAAGVAPGDVGVMTTSNTNMLELVASLRAAGIPAEGMDPPNHIFGRTSPRTLMSFLRCILYPSESTPILHLLTQCPAYVLPPGQLAATLEGHLSRYVPLRTFLRDLSLGGEESSKKGQGQVPAGARAMAGKFLSDMDHFAEAAKTKGIREVMLDFLQHTGQLHALEDPSTEEEEEEAAALAAMFEVVAMAEDEVGGNKAHLIEPVLCLYRQHGTGRMPSSRLGAEDFHLSLSDGKAEGVQVFKPWQHSFSSPECTFHTVFIPQFTHSRYPGNLRSARLPVPGSFRGVPEGLDRASLRLSHSMDRVCHENHCRSDLYMAVGSARVNVCFSVAAQVLRGRHQLNPSAFLYEILGRNAPEGWRAESTCHPFAQELMSTDSDSGTHPAQAKKGHLVVASPVERNSVEELRSLSYSSISSYMRCPYSFYLQHVLNVSPSPSPVMVYGRAMHEAVALCLRKFHDGPPPSLESVAKEFRLHLSGCAFDSAEQVGELLHRGEKGLESFWDRLLSSGVPSGTPLLGEDDVGKGGKNVTGILVEHKFRVPIPEAGVQLSGIFDRVDLAPNLNADGAGCRLSITDYKSNVGTKCPKRMAANSLQLRLYSLGAERLLRTLPAEVVVESIEDGRKGVIEPSTADTDAALEAVTDIADGVRRQRFDATPSFSACSFCGFKHICHHSAAKNVT
ncbi:unnamed protein product [Discosporangium mesarthrocarpum]